MLLFNCTKIDTESLQQIYLLCQSFFKSNKNDKESLQQSLFLCQQNFILSIGKL